MTGKPDEDEYGPEQIAAELSRIADRVRQGPFEPADQKVLITEIEALAKRISRHPDAGPAIARHLEQLAGQLRNAPVKRKNGPIA